MDNVWSIAGHEIKTGEKKQVYVQVMDSEEYMPVTFINGTRDGKTVLVTSGIHGGEYEGIHAACEIARDLKSEDICGQLAIIHPVSVQTFESKQENITPIDGKNLNRVFPPNPHGTLTDKIAWTLWDKFQSHCDFHMDLHGCYSDWITPQVYYTGVATDEVVEIAREAARCVSVGYMVKSVATTGAYNHAGVNGIPGILLERGHSNLLSDDDVILYKKDVINVLKHLGVLEGDPVKPETEPVDVCDLRYINSKYYKSACWHPTVKIDEKFKKGEKLGVVRDFFCNTLDETYAEYDGIILYMYGMMPISPFGFELCYARICDDK